jgi:nucleoid DNA-binding protein
LDRETLAAHIKKAADVSRLKAALCVDAVFEAIADELAEGGAVNLHGFGSFLVTQKAGRNYRDIGGEIKTVPEHGTVLFRPSATIKKAVWSKGK